MAYFGVVLLVLLLLVLVVTGVKQSQHLVLGLRLEFDNKVLIDRYVPFRVQISVPMSPNTQRAPTEIIWNGIKRRNVLGSNEIIYGDRRGKNPK